MNRTPEDWIDIFDLHDHLTAPEIAKAIGCGVQTVRDAAKRVDHVLVSGAATRKDFATLRWRANFQDAITYDLSVAQLAKRMGLPGSSVWIAKRKYGLPQLRDGRRRAAV